MGYNGKTEDEGSTGEEEEEKDNGEEGGGSRFGRKRDKGRLRLWSVLDPQMDTQN